MLYLKNKIAGAKNVLAVYTESTSHPYIKITAMVLLGVSIVFFESMGISMLIPALQKIVDGIDEKIIIPVAWMAPLQNWLNRWDGYQQFALIGVLILFSGICRAFLILVNKLANETISLRIGNHWREKLFQNIILANASKTLKCKIGSLQNYLVVECGRLRFLYRGMLQTFTSIIMGILYIIILFTISVKLTLLTGLIFAVCSVPISALIKRIRQTSYSRAEARSVVGSLIIEILSSLRIIHLFETFNFEFGRFKHSIDDVLNKEFQMVKKDSLVGLINQTTGIIIPLFIIVLGLILAGNSQIRPLWIILFAVIFTRLFPIVQQMFKSMVIISKSYGSLIMIKENIHEFSRHKMKNGKVNIKRFPEKITFKNVTFCYDEKFPVLNSISLTLNRGKHYAFVGPSGSGKSTIVGLIARLFDPDKGGIFLDSVNLRDVDIHSWRNCIGLVDQDASLFNESIRYNISYGLSDISEMKIINAAKMAHAHEFIVKLPYGYDTKAGNLGNVLSGGQKQRVAIARVLIRNPEIVILDEATSSIDLESEKYINDTIDKLTSEGKTIIGISHRLSAVKDAEKLFLVEDGKIKDSGTFSELSSESKTFSNYVKLQNLEL